MTFKMPSNRRIHPQNGKVVSTAIKTIQTTAAISQEKYWNAFRVNGYTCSVYNILTQGKLCSCSSGSKSNVMQPILDEDGNAPREYIDQMLNGGLMNGSLDYGEIPSSMNSYKIKEFDSNAKPTSVNFSTELDTPNSDYIEEDYTDDFLTGELGGVTTSKCSICYGSGFVGGFNLCFGNRLVLDTNYKNTFLFGYSVHQENLPYTYNSISDKSYIDFTVTLPKYLNNIICFNIKNNNLNVSADILASSDSNNFKPVTLSNLIEFCTGQPIILRVSNVEEFTHIEIEFNLTDQPTYLEYPVISKTGDVTILDAIGDIQIYVSPIISEIKPKDIIVDNTLGKVWRVVSVNDHKDRNYNMHGWEINARLVQSYEVYSNLPSVKTLQNQLSTKLNRW